MEDTVAGFYFYINSTVLPISKDGVSRSWGSDPATSGLASTYGFTGDDSPGDDSLHHDLDNDNDTSRGWHANRKSLGTLICCFVCPI